MNERLVNRGNAIAVTAYKVLGFAVLTVILLGLLSYLALQGFFVFNHAWLAPTVLSPTDERILGLNTRLAELAASRERVDMERREMMVKLDDSVRRAEAERLFQDRYRSALRGDIQLRANELSQLGRLMREYDATRPEIGESNKAFASMSRARAEELKTASLLTQEAWLTTNHQLAQMATNRLELESQGVSLLAKLSETKRELGSLSSAMRLASNGSATGSELSTPTLLMHQHFTDSQLELTMGVASQQLLRDSIAAMDGVLATYDSLLAAIRNSPYLKALEGNVTVAFVPYDNASRARPSTKLYGCLLGFVLCREVGVIRGVYQGEIQQQHPVRHETLRGEMVEIELSNPEWVQKDLLHMNRPPLLF